MNDPQTRGRDIVVVGASAGGVSALSTVLGWMPPDLPAAVFVVMHVAPGAKGLPNILSRTAALPVQFAEDGAPIAPGRVYVARPDCHLVLERDRMRLDPGAKQNGFRPAVDPLFESAAFAHGRHVIGVILSGMLDDGTHGLNQIQRHGGITIVQNPEEASFPSMPLNAIRSVAVHEVLDAKDIGQRIAVLTREDVGAERAPAKVKDDAQRVPIMLTCTECGGSLWEVRDGQPPLRFACHVGHGLTAEALLAGQTDTLGKALWAAYRALKEHGALQLRMGQRAKEAGLLTLAEQYETKARESEKLIRMIGAVLNTAPRPREEPAAK